MSYINIPGIGVGPQGIPGSQIITGVGAPSNLLGVDGDFYLNTANGNYYLKDSGVYVLKGNLTGPTGATGATGPAGPPTLLNVDGGTPDANYGGLVTIDGGTP